MSKRKTRIKPGPWSPETHSSDRPLRTWDPETRTMRPANEAAKRSSKREIGKNNPANAPERDNSGGPERE